MTVYLDNAATTAMAPEVLEAMWPVMHHCYGNPSSSHAIGRRSRVQVEQSRRSMAAQLNCHPSNLIFTSGGTEADNLALNAAVVDLGCERIITSEAEHSAVIKTAERWSDRAPVELALVKHLPDGRVDVAHLAGLLAASDKKTLVSLMHANNEVGVMIDLLEVGTLCRAHGALFHSDTVQTMCHYRFDLQALPIDFITCAGHKFHGPKGVGFLYVAPGLKITSIIAGGGQERSMRGGTENVHSIVGLAKAMELAFSDLEHHQTHIRGLKQRMVDGLRARFKGIRFNADSDREDRLYTVLNVSFPPHPKSGMALFLLDLEGVCCSSGSACSSGATLGSHVLRTLGFHDPERVSLRFSFGRYNTEAEVDRALEAVSRVFAGAAESAA